MKKQRTGTGRRYAAVAVSAALMASPLVATPALATQAEPAAQTQDAAQTQAAANTEDAAQQSATTQEDAATQTESGSSSAVVTATTQADLDNAAEGSTVELKGTITEDLTVSKKLTITAASDAVMKGGLCIGANDVTVQGVHFVLDGTTDARQSIRCEGKTGLSVSGCTFDLTNGSDGLNAQMNCIWLGYGANGATFDANTFTIDLPGVDQSYVALNIVGASVADTTVSNNQVTFEKGAAPVASAHFIIANGNRSEAGSYGLTNLKVLGNTVSDATGLTGPGAKTYGIGVSNARDVTISGNMFSGLYLGIKPSMWPNEAPSASIAVTGNDFSGSYVALAMGEKDVEPGAVTSTGNKLDGTTLPYAGVNGTYGLVWQGDDGTLYPNITKAVEAGKTSLALVRNTKETLALGADANVTLDLAGHKLSGSIDNAGTLTIKDSAGTNGATSDVTFGGSGKTTLTGGTYTDPNAPKLVASGYGTLVKVVQIGDGTTTYIVLPASDVKDNAQYRVEKDGQTSYFSDEESAKAFANANGIDASDVKPVWLTATFVFGNGQSDETVRFENGNAPELPETPKCNGWTFAGWYLEKSANGKLSNAFDASKSYDTDLTLYAGWLKANAPAQTDETTPSNADTPTNKALPQTGDTSFVGVAALGAAGAVALGAGVVASKRRAK